MLFLSITSPYFQNGNELLNAILLVLAQQGRKVLQADDDLSLVVALQKYAHLLELVQILVNRVALDLIGALQVTNVITCQLTPLSQRVLVSLAYLDPRAALLGDVIKLVVIWPVHYLQIVGFQLELKLSSWPMFQVSAFSVGTGSDYFPWDSRNDA